MPHTDNSLLNRNHLVKSAKPLAKTVAEIIWHLKQKLKSTSAELLFIPASHRPSTRNPELRVLHPCPACFLSLGLRAHTWLSSRGWKTSLLLSFVAAFTSHYFLSLLLSPVRCSKFSLVVLILSFFTFK